MFVLAYWRGPHFTEARPLLTSYTDRPEVGEKQREWIERLTGQGYTVCWAEVPDGSAFCDWVEERRVFREGVNYGPGLVG